jgi:hypothetical protein
MNRREAAAYVVEHSPELLAFFRDHQSTFGGKVRYARIGDWEWGVPMPKGVEASVSYASQVPAKTKGRRR